MKFVILLIFAFSVTAILPFKQKQTLEAEMEHEGISRKSQMDFENWMLENEKSYDNDFTMTHRMQVYMKNKKSIEKYNRESHTDKYGLNQFSDLEVEEFAQKYLMNNNNLGNESSDENLNFKDHLLSHEKSPNDSSFLSTEEKVEMKDSFDWMKIVPEVQHQEQCGSSWAFAVSDVVIARLVHLGRIGLNQVSKQQFLDCAKPYCQGCAGCHPASALQYVKDNGLVLEKQYPAYTAKQGECKGHGYLGKKMQRIERNVNPSEKDIMIGLKTGPVVALFSIGTGEQWWKYRSGLIDTCSYQTNSNSLAVTIVGFDDSDWIIKNSWGTSWGMQGYFFYPRNNKPQCEKLLEIIYPVF